MLLSQLTSSKLLFTLILSISLSFSSYGQLAEGWVDDQIINGISAPGGGGETLMGTVFNSDGTQMFIWTKSGRVYVADWNGSNYILQSTAALDISEEVGDWRDFGLISIALDPDFDTNGWIYLCYMVDRHHLMHFGTGSYNPNTDEYYNATITRLTKYQMNIGSSPLTTNYGTRTILLGETKETGVPLLHESHAGGSIVFGTDGSLLMTTGDNASYSTVDTGSVGHTYYAQALADDILRPNENVGAFRSQMPTSLCGKVLRLNPANGDGLPSNPLYDGDPRSPESRMWAMGLRNPFRMSIEPGSGSTNPNDGDPGIIHVADVGWNVWEDLHIFDKAGLNAGWPLYEGQTKHNGYYNSGTTNPDEGNQPFVNNCVQPSSFVDNADPALRRYVHNRPEVAWKHGGTNEARVPWFSGSSPTQPKIADPGSPTTGINFRGNTATGGVYIVGDALGSSMNGKYIFSDYVRNWVNVATFTDGTLNWISNVSQIAPNGYGDGIVHLYQNPLDGSVYFTNIFNSTVHRLTFVVPEWTDEPMDMTVECDGTSDPGGAYAAWLASFDGTVGCGSKSLTNDSNGLSDLCGGTGSESVTFTLSDGCGNEISKTVTFTVVDTIDPAWTVAPSDMTVDCGASANDQYLAWLSSFSGADDCGSASVSHDGPASLACTETANVTFTLTDECGNSIDSSATFFIQDTLGVQENQVNELQIYPNPANNHLFINGLRDQAKMSIYNLTGQLVFQKLVQNNRPIEIDLISGIYLVKIVHSDQTSIKKLVVQ